MLISLIFVIEKSREAPSLQMIQNRIWKYNLGSMVNLTYVHNCT